MSGKINVDYMFLYPEVIFKHLEEWEMASYIGMDKILTLPLIERKNKIPFEYRAYLKQQFNFLKQQYSQSKGKK